MNHKTTIKTLAFVAIAYLAGSAWASTALRTAPGADDVDSLATDTLSEPIKRFLPGEIRDTVAFNEEQRAKDRQLYQSQIKLIARTYGDSVVLRWSAPDYVAWRHINRVGVNILRISEGSADIDTLKMAFKPTPLEEFRRLYPESDSIAQMGFGSIYNLDHPNPYATKDEAGTMGSLFEVHQDQMMALGVSVLVSEWRPDVANHMAMRWVDRTAKRGKTYSYSVVPAEDDTTMTVMLNPGFIEEVKNVPTKPAPFDVQIGDSINPPNGVRIWWENRSDYSSYEIERRLKGESKWKRLNKRPYLVMLPEQGGTDCFFGDNVPKPGTYEYRVMAHDPFGELTEPSRTLTVHVGDMEPPRAPEITWINIDRPREDAPADEIWAEIHFEKDTMEADYAGCIPMYFHERVTNGEWRALLDKPLSRTDTVCRVDVTNLMTGSICMAAYDTAHNVSYSIPQLLRVTDMRPPLPPQGLKAETSLQEVEGADMPIGLITVTWHPLESDDIDYYEIVFANDSTHQFMTQKHGIVNDTMFVDTVAADVNQKYIYYKVRAVDYSTNIGDFSELLQVVRPSAIPPTVAHLDSSYVDGKGIFMRRIVGTDEQMAYHNVYRKLIDSDKEWTLLRRCDGDSVKACNDYIDLTDVPKVNSSEEYVYAVESFNYSGVSSGLSVQFCTRFTGDAVFTQPIRLFASYDGEKQQTRLAWEVDNAPEGDEWYFCIWRQGPEDDRFKFLLSAEPTERDFSDFLLQPGQTAHYYIQIQMEDGRESEPSNIVTIKAPEKR